VEWKGDLRARSLRYFIELNKTRRIMTIGDCSPFPMREGTAYDILKFTPPLAGVDGAAGAFKCAPRDVG
jgi:hypothetical protein